MHHGTLLVGIENGGHWPWPSRSFWPFWLRIVGNLACPRDNSSQIWTGITKFTPNMHPGIFSAGIDNGGHWPWPSRSFWPFWLTIIGNLAWPCNNMLWIWDKVTKFAPNIHPGIFSAVTENGGHWPWPSRSFGHFTSRNSTPLSYTDLGRPRGVTRPKRALVIVTLQLNLRHGSVITSHRLLGM